MNQSFPLGMTMAELRKFTKDLHDSVEVCICTAPDFLAATKSAEISILVNPSGHRMPVLVLTPQTQQHD